MAIRRELFQGETLYRQGAIDHCAWVIERGAVELTSGVAKDFRRLGLFGVGDLVGELSALDGTPHTATATALEECVLLQIDRDQFRERIAGSDAVVQSLVGSLLDYRRGMLARMPAGVELPAEDVACDDPVERAGNEKVHLESHLREALEKHTLDVCYQPVYDLRERRVASYEALLRWNLPDHGPVSPAVFIPLAEETSLIVPLGEYVLDRVVETLAALRDAGGACPGIAVNLSAKNFMEPGVAAHIRSRVREAGLSPDLLKLEVTESQSLDYAQVATVMQRCREAGITFSLDDFGTGYSNLTHLQELAFEYVKIDQGFVRRMLAHERALALVRAIVDMVHSLGASAICEGVETRAQLQTLANLGVRYVQGYLIGKAAPAAEVLSGAAVRRAEAAVAAATAAEVEAEAEAVAGEEALA